MCRRCMCIVSYYLKSNAKKYIFILQYWCGNFFFKKTKIDQMVGLNSRVNIVRYL
jgi:hypothetical protein